MPTAPFEKSAILSDCGKYRYALTRGLEQHGPNVLFIMVNPSTADAEQDDATIRKCIGFARRLGAGELMVGNLFAYRATDVRELKTAKDPIGPDNDKHLREMMRSADNIIVAWGALNKLPEKLRSRWKDIVRMADALRPEIGPCDLTTIGICADKHPKHPLMVGYDAPIKSWEIPWFVGRTDGQSQESKP